MIVYTLMATQTQLTPTKAQTVFNTKLLWSPTCWHVPLYKIGFSKAQQSWVHFWQILLELPLTRFMRITWHQVQIPLGYPKKRGFLLSLLGFFFGGGGGLKRKNLQISPFTSKFSWLLSSIISFHLKQTKNNPLPCPDVSMQARNTWSNLYNIHISKSHKWTQMHLHMHDKTMVI